MSHYSAQARTRLCWTSFPSQQGNALDLAPLPVTWQDCLDDGARVPLDAIHQPRTKCPTLMASARSHSDRLRSTWVRGTDGKPRPLSTGERERLVGMQTGDTAAKNVSDTSRRRMCGNAFPVGWIAHMLSQWLNHTRTLRPLASRSPAGTVCGSIASITIPQPTQSSLHSTSVDSPSILERIRHAAQADSTYQDILRQPPAGYKVQDSLLFAPTENKQWSLVIPADNS
eukprot:scaffold597_cov554-Pavlova_lutheri.AAC.1